ncbi:uncharacterized protein LOC135202983 [Macrobrachium nipponense]|uniref:uncharacterized protein LOC135202983 n=1 Tax=Macrobrachium nipponense TaxID=159736 RepID=UPI0030C867E1
MGPIRAFVRPSCAAATPDHSHAPASFFCPSTQPFPSHHQHPHHHHHHHHRPYCAHVPATLPPHHHHYLHHHHHPSSRHPLYIATAGGGGSGSSSSSSPSPSDPQRVGLVVSPGPKPSLYSHFKKFLPPGVPLAGPLPVLSALSQGQGKGWRAVVDGGGVGGLECEGKWDEGQKDYEWGRREKGEKGSSKDKGESSDKRNSTGEEIKWKKDCSQNKWKTGSTCNSSTSSGSAICNGSKLDPTSPKSQWRKTNDEGGIREAGGGEEAKGKRDSRAAAATTPLTACLSSLLKKHEDPLPSTSRVALVFPFSEDEDEDDDEDNGYDDCCEGGGAVPGGESRRVTWPISDIVETEDEEGETLQAVKDVANEKGIHQDEKEEKETNYRLLATGKHCKGEKDREEEEGELRKGGKNRDLEVKKAGKEEPDSNQRKSAKPTDLSDACRVLNHLVNVVIKHPHVRVPEGTLVSAAPASAAGGVLQDNDKGRKRDEVTVSHQGRSSHPPLTEEHSEGTVADSLLNKKEKRQSGDVLLGKDGRTREGEVTGGSKKAEEEEGEEEEDHEEREEGEEEGEKQKDGVRATQRLRPRSYRQFLLTRERRSRVFLKERSYHLGRWFVTHFTHPYPSKEQKDVLAAKTKMTRNQVSEWFGNMRRRIREATRGRGICWEERVRIYNSVITGKSEPLPIMPEDEINTWVPPVAQDPPTTDPHEEVSASQKFKTTLLHRYLNNSEAGDFCSADGMADSTNSAPINATATFIVNSSLMPTSGGDFLRHYQEGPSTSSDTAETQTEGFLSNHFPHIFPLCTSSPKENIKKLWNNSFEHIKDNYMPPVNNRILIKEQRVKPVQGGSSDETRKLAKRSETMLHGDEGTGQTSAKKARIAVSPNREWFQRPSTSKYPSDQGVICSQFEAEKSKDLLRSHIVSGPKVPLSCWGIRRPVIEHSRSIGEKSSEEEHSRQPEELAAAYTLMQLQHM